MHLYSCLLVAVLLVLAIHSVFAQPGNGRGRGHGRRRPIDEILDNALPEELRGRGRGRGKGRGPRYTPDNSGIIRELDIATLLPVEEIGEEAADSKPGRPSKKKGNNRRRQNNSRQKRNAIIDSSGYWPNGVVPYKFVGQFSSEELAVFGEAVTEYNKYTCIEWKVATSELRYVDIIRGEGCWSWIGYFFWQTGSQNMTLSVGCLNDKRTPIHEMMHTLGVHHEHGRPDRNTYVTVNYQNIDEDDHDAFEVKDAADVNLFSTPYSYKSIMHYGEHFFSNNSQPTIVTTDPAFQDKIGNRATFSYEDIQLLTAMYQCSASCQPAACPAGSFQGHDCNCYCKTTDDDNPAANCGTVCINPEQTCACGDRTGACSGIPHSTCQSSGACECDSGYVNHGNACTLITSITCTELDVDCKCSLNTGACTMANSECDTGSNSCKCKTGFAEDSSGNCIDINSVGCLIAGTPCYCSLKGANPCSAVSNSACDSNTDSCKCDGGFYKDGGICTAVPACTQLGQNCHCEVHASSPCSQLANSICDELSGACVCDPTAYHQVGAVCQLSHIYVGDGSSISPFTASIISTTNFSPTQGSDASAFGVASNNWYLHASGTGTGDVAAMESDWLTVVGDWCLEYAVKLNNARVYSEYTWSGSSWGYSSLYTPGAMSYFYERGTYKRPTGSSDKIKFRVKAEPYTNGAWSVSIDPVKVYKC